jgi:small subunit ribosomal protein MRP21
MELRTATEMLLRPQPSPLLSLLSTSARSSNRRHALLSTTKSKPFVCFSCRQFSVGTPRWKPNSGKPSPPPSQFNWQRQTPSPKRGNAIDSADVNMLNDAMDSSPTPGVASQRRQHFKSPSARAAQTLQYSPEQLRGSSVTDAINAFQQPASWTQPRQQGRPSVKASQTDDLLFPPPRAEGLVPDTASQLAPMARPRVLHELNIHLSPGTGRTIEVDENNPTDLGLRLRQLEMLVARNKIRLDIRRQKFHERGGLKRKRLASERWRRRFRTGFNKTVTRVQELRRKGW